MVKRSGGVLSENLSRLWTDAEWKRKEEDEGPVTSLDRYFEKGRRGGGTGNVSRLWTDTLCRQKGSEQVADSDSQEMEGGRRRAGACHVFGQTHCKKGKSWLTIRWKCSANVRKMFIQRSIRKTGACHVFGQTHCAMEGLLIT